MLRTITLLLVLLMTFGSVTMPAYAQSNEYEMYVYSSKRGIILLAEFEYDTVQDASTTMTREHADEFADSFDYFEVVSPVRHRFAFADSSFSYDIVAQDDRGQWHDGFFTIAQSDNFVYIVLSIAVPTEDSLALIEETLRTKTIQDAPFGYTVEKVEDENDNMPKEKSL